MAEIFSTPDDLVLVLAAFSHALRSTLTKAAKECPRGIDAYCDEIGPALVAEFKSKTVMDGIPLETTGSVATATVETLMGIVEAARSDAYAQDQLDLT